jgi:CBS domain containing-hemolysin-like protein
MLDAIFDLNELVVRQVTVPRTEVVAVEADASLAEIIELATQSTYTKLPVYEDNLDQIIGIVHVKDLLHAMQSQDAEKLTARMLAREPIYVPETTPVNFLLQNFRDNRQHIAIVLDEFGGTAGLVTLEDLLEEIVGEVSDPFDAVTPEIQLLPNGNALVGGLALIEDVNSELHLTLEDPNYDTIAGYVLGKLGHIPSVRERVEGDGVGFTVEAMDGMRIARLRLDHIAEVPKKPPAAAESPAEE